MNGIPFLLLMVLAADAPPPGAELYRQTRINMAAILENQPNFVCVETIERSERRSPKAKFAVVDSLRFEVAYVNHHELYGWPGAKKFEETDLPQLVPNAGAIGTGSFAGHAQSIFQNRAADILQGEWTSIDGRRLARYNYVVTPDHSRYMLHNGAKESATVGYSGEILVDPDTARVLRFNVRADHIPASLRLDATETVIEYGSVRIGDRALWLPVRSSDSISAAGGHQSLNKMGFAGCRAFTGESTLRFDDPEPGDTPAPPPKEVTLPEGVWFEIQLAGGLDTDTLHVGDLIPAELGSDMKSHGVVLFPKGSSVELRLARVQRLADRLTADLVLGEVSSKTAYARLHAIPDSAPVNRASNAGGLPQFFGDAAHPGVGTLFVRTSRLNLRKGYRITWRTIRPKEPPASPATAPR